MNNTITDCTCDYCGHDWKCELSVAQTMACPGCGDKPDIKPSKPVTKESNSMSDINWDEAPEWADRILIDLCASYYADERSYQHFNSDKRVFFSNYDAKNKGSFTTLHTKPVTLSPVYTEAMSNHSIEPIADMEVMIKDSSYDNKYYKSVISFIGRDNIIWTHAGTEYAQRKQYLEFKVIDTRTDEEKCYDDLSKIGITQQSLIDAIRAGKIHNVTWGK